MLPSSWDPIAAEPPALVEAVASDGVAGALCGLVWDRLSEVQVGASNCDVGERRRSCMDSVEVEGRALNTVRSARSSLGKLSAAAAHTVELADFARASMPSQNEQQVRSDLEEGRLSLGPPSMPDGNC